MRHGMFGLSAEYLCKRKSQEGTLGALGEFKFCRIAFVFELAGVEGCHPASEKGG